MDMRKIYYVSIEVMSLLCLIWAFYPVFHFSDLGDNALIPIHYNFQGEVDGWGNRSSLWAQPIIALIVYIVFSVLGRYPEKLNYPIKVTKENKEISYKLMVNMLRYLKLICLILFAYGSNLSFGIATGKHGDKNHYVIVGLVVLMLLLTLFYVFRMIINQRK